MLFRRTLREMRHNKGQVISIFILSFLALSMFAVMKSSNYGAYEEMKTFHSETNLADGWLYGEGFTTKNLQAVKQLEEVNDAQLRLKITTKSEKQNQAQIEVILEDENIVTKPYIMDGVEFNTEDFDSLWLSERFADEWNLSVGDSFAFSYHGVTVTKKIAGLIASPEYEYMCADKDMNTDFKNIAYVYMPYKAFPIKEYILHMIETGDLTVADILKHSSVLDTLVETMKANGMEIQDVTKEMFLKYVKGLEKEKLYSMMPYTQMIITTDQKDVLSLEPKLANAVSDYYAVFIDQTSILGIKAFVDELNQHDQISYAFVLTFVLIVVLVIMTTMNRIVEQQRTQIGTMSAMGMKQWKIVFHYMSYSFFISLLGSVIGLFIGTYWWGQLFADLFTDTYTLPVWNAQFDNSFYFMALLVVLVCTASSYISCRKLLKVKPAEALRPSSPKSGKSCIFEHFPFWNRLGFSSQYNFRDISRAKLRTFMGIFGTAAGMMTLTCGLASNTSVNNTTDWVFTKLQKYNYECQFSEDITTSKADDYAKRYSGELVMNAPIELSIKERAVSNEKKTTNLVVTEGKGIFGLTDVHQNTMRLSEGTIAISSKLAKSLGVSIGDTVYWHIYTENEWYQSTIGAINRSPTSSGITMLRSDFEITDAAYKPTMLYTNEDIKELENDSENIVTVYNKEDIRNAFQEYMSAIFVVVIALTAFAVVLILVVLYNSGNLSFHERIQEFATLKVLGFQTKQIRYLLTLQNIWFSVIGVILGAPFARIILTYMFDGNGDGYDYEPVVSVSDYMIGAGVVLLVSVFVSFFFSKKIKKLDMVEILKGIE